MSISEIRRREKAGQLVPSFRNELGWAIFSERDIEPAIEAKAKKAIANAQYTSEEAALVFKVLARGGSPIDAVMESKVHPDLVEPIAQAYARLSGGMFIPGAVMAKVNQLPLEGVFPVETPQALLDILKDVADDTCEMCRRREKRVCKSCASRLR